MENWTGMENPAEIQPESLSDAANQLRRRVSKNRWLTIASAAAERAQVIDEVKRRHRDTGLSMRATLREVAPAVSWSCFNHWRRRLAGEDPDWERLLDRRVPPPKSRITPEVARSAVTLRLVDPAMECEAARRILVSQFGEAGNISDTSLRRIWREGGLNQQPIVRQEKEKRFDGGAGLALLCAAAVETNAFGEMATAVLKAGREAIDAQEPRRIKQEHGGRDELGRLTSEYNRVIREGMTSDDVDFRRFSDADKRQGRDLADLSVIESRPAIIGSKLFAIGVIPLLTERRGFDGLEGPRGAWLEVLGGHPYMPTTLDKFLAEVALLNAGSALWEAHARHWKKVVARWSEDGPSWLRYLVYVDATADPHWTYEYAKSGRVCRVGRVMPCLSRVALTAGPGVPLLMETHAGTVSLKNELLPTLDRLESIVGTENVEGLTVIMDAEMATFMILEALHNSKDRSFVTVLKGRKAPFKPLSDWLPYRERDEVREGEVLLVGSGDHAGKQLLLRAVEMRREESSHPTSTIFLTGGSYPQELATQDVASAYLSRWPHQESCFRNARNGGGLERSHGYGGQWVTNVALGRTFDESLRRQNRAHAGVVDAEYRLEQLKKVAEKTTPGEKRNVLNEVVKDAQHALRDKVKNLKRTEQEFDKSTSAPALVYERDTTRENIVTALTLTVFTLVEYVLKEYFGNLKMELRTFIELFVGLPITIQSTVGRQIFMIHANARSPERMEQLQEACTEITRRKIRRNGRLLVFKLVDPGGS